MIISLSVSQLELLNSVYGQGMNNTAMDSLSKDGSIPISKIITGFLGVIKLNAPFSISSSIDKAISDFPGSILISVFIENHNNFLVYVINLIDKDNHLHKIIIDPINGQILKSTKVGYTNPNEILMSLHNIMHGNQMNMMCGSGMNMSPGINMMNMSSVNVQ